MLSFWRFLLKADLNTISCYASSNKNKEAYMANDTTGMGKLLPLHNLQNVNTVIGMLYDKNGVYRAGFDPNIFYNTILLDSLKYGEENYVHLSAAETLTIRRGDTTARFRRWAGLTPSLTPLKEGVPPSPDKHAYETIEVGNVFSFGRWSEYTDKLDLSIVNEVLAERSVQYGEVANQTKELYARKTWLATPNEFFANFKQGFQELVFGDEIRLDDLRFLVARMKRMMVKPVGGKFNYVCSPEFINGLIDDPRVKQYMEIEQTTGKLWTTGQQFDMFELSFIPTMLDEFAYPDIEFPGVFERADGVEVIRLYAMASDAATIYYLDIHEGMTVGPSTTKAKVTGTGTSYLKDGSAIDELVKWEVPTSFQLTWDTNVQGLLVVSSVLQPTTTKAVLRKQTRSINNTTKQVEYGAIGAGVTGDITAVNLLLTAGAFMQLPVHRGILFGAEALVKLVMEGVSDSPKIVIKALGSSGVADPIDQRQSIGFKVDGFGLAIKRPEAIVVTFGIPRYAELAALTEKVVFKDYEPSFLTDAEAYEQDNANSIGTDGTGKLRVDGVNKGGKAGSPNVAGANEYPIFRNDTAYAKGKIVIYNNEVFIFNVAHSAGNFVRSEVKRYIDTLEKDVLGADGEGNDSGSNVK
jgi:N4-gp56 family major capsid protein